MSSTKKTPPAAIHELEKEKLNAIFYQVGDAVQTTSDEVVRNAEVPKAFIHPEVRAKWLAYLDKRKWNPEAGLKLILEAKELHNASGGERSLHLETSEAIELTRLHRYQEAKEVAQDSLDTPGFDQLSSIQQWRLLVNAAFVAFQMGELARADALYEQACQRDQEQIPTLANWAVVKNQQGDRTGAQVLVNQVIQIVNKYPEREIEWANKKDKYPELIELSAS